MDFSAHPGSPAQGSVIAGRYDRVRGNAADIPVPRAGHVRGSSQLQAAAGELDTSRLPVRLKASQLAAAINHRSAFSDAWITGVWKAAEVIKLAKSRARSRVTLSVSKMPSPAAALGLRSV